MRKEQEGRQKRNFGAQLWTVKRSGLCGDLHSLPVNSYSAGDRPGPPLAILNLHSILRPHFSGVQGSSALRVATARRTWLERMVRIDEQQTIREQKGAKYAHVSDRALQRDCAPFPSRAAEHWQSFRRELNHL